MLTYLTENASTILASLVLIVVIAAVVVYLVKRKKQGKSACGCCSHCAMQGACHPDNRKQKPQA